LRYQANWELVIKLVRNIPGKDEDEIVNNCEDLLYISLFIPQFKDMNFIYSQFQYI